jgi:mandelamide amidase
VALNGEQVPTFPIYIRNTDPGSNAGIPGVSLPAGRSDEGLPIGMELDGPKGSDARLLAIAAALEALLAAP